MKYFTYCHMTTSELIGGTSRYRRLNAKAPEGFIFHDTEKPLELTDIRRALFKLTPLFENTINAFVFRVDKHTLVASFSALALPKPVTINKPGRWVRDPTDGTYGMSGEVNKLYPVTNDLPGWYIPRVDSLIHAETAFDIGNLYDNCTQLQRLMGTCPCPHKDSGVCLTENVLPIFNGAVKLEDLQSNFYQAFTDAVKGRLKREFSDLDSFEFVSPAYTTDQDFYEGLRPWDDIHFDKVETRRKVFEERGQSRKSKNEYLANKCKSCHFKLINKDSGNFTSCVKDPTNCTGVMSKETAIELIDAWYENEGKIDPTAFSKDEVTVLQQLLGNVYKVKIPSFSTVRRIDVELCGFIDDRFRTSTFAVSANGGDRLRTVYFKNFTDLVSTIPQIEDDIKKLKVSSYYIPDYPKEVFWAMALLRRVTNYPGGWGSRYWLRQIKVALEEANFDVTPLFSNGRYQWAGRSLSLNNFPRGWISPYITGTEAQAYATLNNHRILRNKHRLPVIDPAIDAAPGVTDSEESSVDATLQSLD